MNFLSIKWELFNFLTKIPLNFRLTVLFLLLLTGVSLANDNNSKGEEMLGIVQQGITISGTVTDENGEAMPGVTVIVKGNTQVGQISDVNGKFTLSVPDRNSILVFSSIGYVTQEIAVGNNQIINVKLSEDMKMIDEVVVVGYGTQKRVNLTGSVSSVDSKVLDSRSITNVAQGLQGMLAGLNVSNPGGRPDQAANFNIRGYAGRDGVNGQTYEPLVIVDGVSGYMRDLNPNDIESVTVLKDAASTAIYGSRAAYGVVLITTKSGKREQRPTISYNNNISWQSPTVLPKTAGSVAFAELFREASINSGGGGVIDLETMDRIRKYAADPNSIPSNVPSLSNPQRWADWNDGRCNGNEDWAKAMFKPWQMNQSHSISILGGTERTSYAISVGNLYDQGKLRYYDDYYSRTNITTRLSVDVTSWLTASANIRFAQSKTDMPSYGPDIGGGINALINWIYVVWPTIPLINPNGHFSTAGRMLYIDQAQPDMTYTDNFYATGSALFKILPGWTANFDYLFNKWDLKRTYSRGPIIAHDVSGEPYYNPGYLPSDTQVWKRTENDDFTSIQLFSTYTKSIGGHSFTILGGMQQEYKKTYSLSADRREFIILDMQSLNNAFGLLNASDGEDHWTTRGFFGRVNYDFNSKYLFEFNIRRDGSSRYAEGHKWGVFPGVSAGWNIAREEFFEPLQKYVSELKLRGAYGELGNQRGASYQYISTISHTQSSRYIMDGVRISHFGTPSISALNTWETSRTLDLGIDIAALRNRLTASYTWYQKDILGLIAPSGTYPATLGADPPNTNAADMRNIGFELSLGWRDKVMVGHKPLNYSVYANLSDYRGKVLSYYNPQGLINTWYAGRNLGEIWGLTTSHVMIDDAEAAEVQKTDYQRLIGNNWVAGDIKYKDINNEGKIREGTTIDDPGALSVIGNNTPRYQYGFGLNLAWNGFDMSSHFQGIGKRDLWLSGALAWGIGGGQWDSNVWQNTLDCWREDRSNLNPYWPRFYLGSTSKNLRTQTKYLDNAAYLRLKNTQVGYSIPQSISRKLKMEKLRFYISGENLLTFSKINENYDPEVPARNVYPLSKSISMGLQVTF